MYLHFTEPFIYNKTTYIIMYDSFQNVHTTCYCCCLLFNHSENKCLSKGKTANQYKLGIMHIMTCINTYSWTWWPNIRTQKKFGTKSSFKKKLVTKSRYILSNYVHNLEIHHILSFVSNTSQMFTSLTAMIMQAFCILRMDRKFEYKQPYHM